MNGRVSGYVVGFALAAACMTVWGTREAYAQWGYGGFSGGYYHASSFGGFGGCAPFYAPPPVYGYGFAGGYTHFGHGGYFVPPVRRHVGFGFSYGRTRGFHPGFYGGRGFHRGHGFHRGYRGHGFHRGYRGRW